MISNISSPPFANFNLNIQKLNSPEINNNIPAVDSAPEEGLLFPAYSPLDISDFLGEIDTKEEPQSLPVNMPAVEPKKRRYADYAERQLFHPPVKEVATINPMDLHKPKKMKLIKVTKEFDDAQAARLHIGLETLLELQELFALRALSSPSNYL